MWTVLLVDPISDIIFGQQQPNKYKLIKFCFIPSQMEGINVGGLHGNEANIVAHS